MISQFVEYILYVTFLRIIYIKETKSKFMASVNFFFFISSTIMFLNDS